MVAVFDKVSKLYKFLRPSHDVSVSCMHKKTEPLGTKECLIEEIIN